MLLSVAVAASDPLLDAVRVPGQIVVDDQRAELQVHTLGGGLGRDHDAGPVAELLNDGGLDIDRPRSGSRRVVRVPVAPIVVDGSRVRIVVRAAHGHDLAGIARLGEQPDEILLGAARLGEDNCLAGRAKLGRESQRGLKRADQRIALGVVLDTLGQCGVASQLAQLFTQQGQIDIGRGGRFIVPLILKFVEGFEIFFNVCFKGLQPLQPPDQFPQCRANREA